MTRRLTRRVLWGILTIICIYVFTFTMVVLVPGNPLGDAERNIPREVEQALRVRYSMDNNWLYFWEFLGGAVRLDFGPSFTYRDWTCNQIIAHALPVSLMVGSMAILLAVMFGVPLGVISARTRNRGLDVAVTGCTLLGISLPTFVVGTVLLLGFAVKLQLAPVGGWGTLAHLPLPVLTLSIPFMVYIARLTRVAMVDVLGSDFVRTALAKGMPPRTVVWKHALRVAFLPVLSYLGPAAAQAMTGSFVVEKVFGVPGLGQHFVNAALNRDPGLIMATVVVFSTILVALNLAIDVVYERLDPRISGAV